MDARDGLTFRLCITSLVARVGTRPICEILDWTLNTCALALKPLWNFGMALALCVGVGVVEGMIDILQGSGYGKRQTLKVAGSPRGWPI